MDLFRETYGVGGTGEINFYKYSPQLEVFIGFDQAYAKTHLTEKEFLELLKESAANNNYRLNHKFVGYFLQFKVVNEMQKRMKRTPPAITAKPHYRASLDTTKNANTGLSQHELLFRLSKNAGAFVYYACPMILDRSALYDILVDLNTLRLCDLDSCPSDYSDNDRHYIYFNDVDADPIWCSEPTEGKAIEPANFAQVVLDHAARHDAAELAAKLLALLTDVEQFGLSGNEQFFKISDSPASMLGLLGSTLTIVQISEPRG
jgi:hypothetical protein